MKKIRWDALKSARLKRTRGASFEEILASAFIGIGEHHTRAHQKIMLFKHKGYIWLVPFVETNEEVFLKTLYPSRKYTKFYRGRTK
ncbi:MAG TPA: toxin [Candidatus Omnitrophica bacterium]|nr:toxin [Candidatus Omnitrophota bacterium]